MYHEDGQLVVNKGLMTFEDFKEAYEPHKSKECVLHFRIKTHGETNAENTHPFLIDSDLGMVHNGIISKVDTKSDPSKSDTYHFTDFHLHRFRQDNPYFFLNPIYKELIEDYIGFSKLIFMDKDGNVEIFNESKGVWDAGCWFSNTSYKPYSPPQNNWKSRKQNNFNTTQPETTTPWSKPSNDMLKQGDTCRTNYAIYPGLSGDLDNVIPEHSWVKIMYFKNQNMVGIEEILTQIKAEVHVSFLTRLQDIKEEEKANAKTVSVQDEQLKLIEIEDQVRMYSDFS